MHGPAQRGHCVVCVRGRRGGEGTVHAAEAPAPWPACARRPGEGSLLPLWKFQSEKAKRRQVTALCWNPQYDDMFAVGYGSYEFLKQASGLVSLYSLKNPSHPEFSLHTESGVMCLDFHPELSHLLAVGCYDGSVLVYDIHQRVDAPIYQASVKTGKHNDPVWQIFWQVDEANKGLQFVSISSDGNVNLWILTKSELVPENLMKLRVVKEGDALEDDPAASGPAGGCCMDFCKVCGRRPGVFLCAAACACGTQHALAWARARARALGWRCSCKCTMSTRAGRSSSTLQESRRERPARTPSSSDAGS